MEPKKNIAVLIIDDDDMVLSALGQMMEKTGWKCLRAPSGEIGIDSFKANSVDAVVLDINLPRMDGFAVLRQLRELKPDVPVIMLTGLGYEKDQIEKALEQGAAGYVSKAMPVKSVISKIKLVLGK
jgi:putative two-component system response regulator